MRFRAGVRSFRLPHLLAACIGTFAAEAAHGEGCDGRAIDARFAEALRVCSPSTAPNAVDRAADGSITAVDAAPILSERAPVAVRMPGYRARLNEAKRTLRGRSGGSNSALITSIAARYRINPHLLASMVHAESGGRQRAVSPKGALGLMQVMPDTARSLGVRDPRAMLDDPVLAVSAGAVYLKQLQARFGNNVPLVVAAYNAGPGAVRKAGNRVPDYRETRGYVRKVVSRYAAAGGGR